MIDIKKVYVQAFLAIKNDTKLLDLLGVAHENVDANTLVATLREQVIEATTPENLLNNYKTRLCIHERDGGYRGKREAVDYLAIDIHIPKDRNMQTGLLSDIVKRLIEVLDTGQRKKQGLQPLKVGLYGLKYNTKVFSERAGTVGWEKYTVVFEYRYIL